MDKRSSDKHRRKEDRWKSRLKSLIATYEDMAKKMRQGTTRTMLENIIEDLKQVLRGAQ